LGNWFRAYGNENWEFDDNGLMRRREASINDVAITDNERKFFWDAPGPRPSDHVGIVDVKCSDSPNRPKNRQAASSGFVPLASRHSTPRIKEQEYDFLSTSLRTNDGKKDSSNDFYLAQ
jgi:Protein of unknown function (DUF1348)